MLFVGNYVLLVINSLCYYEKMPWRRVVPGIEELMLRILQASE